MILTLWDFIRLLIGFIDLIFTTAIVYTFSFLPNNLLGHWYRILFRYWCWVFIRALQVNLYLYEKNINPLPKQYILIGNHPSAFEDLGMSALFDAYFLAKVEMKDWWILGRISQAAGTFYVQRECKDSRQEASDTLHLALEKGLNVGLYPEGGCKGRRIFLPFRFGAFELSLKTGIPIVPVFIHYEAQESFEWQSQHLLYKLWQIIWTKNRRANYYVYDAISPTQFISKEDYCNYVQNLYLQWQKKYLE